MQKNKGGNEMPGEFIVLITGQLKAGKSSFANALMGKEILPTDCVPVTGVIAEIRYGEKNKMTIFPRKDSGLDGPIVLQEPTTEDIRTYSFIGSINQDICYERIVIEYNLPLLKEGFVLVDMYGLGRFWYNDSIVEHYFAKADVIIYLMSGTMPYTNDDKNALAEMNQIGLKNLIVAYTRFGDIRESYKNRPLGIFEEYIPVLQGYALKHTDLGTNGIHFIDSLDALNARLGNDEALLLSSGLPKLEEQLRMMLHNRSMEVKQLQNDKRKVSLLKAIRHLYTITDEVPKDEMCQIREELRAAQERIQNK